MKRSIAIRVNNKEEFLEINKIQKYRLEKANVNFSKNPCIYLWIYNARDYRKDINKEQFRIVSFNNFIKIENL